MLTVMIKNYITIQIVDIPPRGTSSARPDILHPSCALYIAISVPQNDGTLLSGSRE
jgi:hypothetical protein